MWWETTASAKAPNKYGVVYSRTVENSKRIVFYFSRRSLRIQVMRIRGARTDGGGRFSHLKGDRRRKGIFVRMPLLSFFFSPALWHFQQISFAVLLESLFSCWKRKLLLYLTRLLCGFETESRCPFSCSQLSSSLFVSSREVCVCVCVYGYYYSVMMALISWKAAACTTRVRILNSHFSVAQVRFIEK